MEKPKFWWFWIRVSALIGIADNICLLILGRYWAWELKFMAWELNRKVKKRNA